MKIEKSKSWQHRVTGMDGNVELFGVNVFNYKWESLNERVPIRDPLYGAKYNFNTYKIIVDSKEYTFAAGEFSNMIWGFYTFDY